MKRPLTTWGLVSIVLVAAIVLAITALSFWEPSDVERNSVSYLLKVPSDAKQFPVWNSVTPPRFQVNVADGEKPSATLLRYDSSLPISSLIAEARKLNFNCRRFQDGSMICDREARRGASQQLVFETVGGAGHSTVTALFVGY